jgi:replicative DNA helicase
MERTSFRSLGIKKIPQVVDEALEFITRRKNGLEPSLKVKSSKINDTFLNGFDWNRIITVAGLSGAGKSTLVRQLITEMIDLNPNQKFEVLSFQFEMLGIDEVARDISARLNKSVKDIYSATTPLTDTDLENIKKELDKLRDYKISIVDNPGTVKEIKDTILNFVETYKLADTNKGLVISIDNSLLVKREERQDEKAVLDDLMFTLVALKKYLSSIGVKVMFFLVSQLNRNIESVERVSNNKLHYPNKNDLFGASSIYNGSDYVIIAHKPCIIDGIGNWYGSARKGWPEGLPVFNPNNSAQAMIYLHVIKERFGKPSIIAMLDDLQFGKISEYTK